MLHLTRACIRGFRLTTFSHLSKSVFTAAGKAVPTLGTANSPLTCKHALNGSLSAVTKLNFHTTPKRFNPIISTIARQIIKVASIVAGRVIRNWWKNLPADKKKAFTSWLAKHKWKFINTIALLAAYMVFYYYNHIEETPLTKRKRFIAFTTEQFNLINKIELESQLQLFNSKLLSNEDKSTQRVAKVAKQLLDRNKDLEQIKSHEWSVSVINDENTVNAFVLPSGNIFVFTGLLKICENDDQLGVVLAHEISHAILGHGIEMASHAHIVDMIFISLLGFLWMLLPTDLIASIATAVYRLILNVSLDTPYSKMLEVEADEVGLELAAKACFDVREASAFWSKMSIIEKEVSLLGQMPLNIEFLTTHPSHDKRSDHIESLMTKALEQRNDCGCGSLPREDPRERVKKQHDTIVTECKEKKYSGVLKIKDL